MRIERILCAALVVTASPSGAQEAPIADWPLAAGARVRILSPALGDRQQIGNVASATWDTLVFIPVKRSASTAIATPNIVRIDVSKGKHTQMGKGAVMGFLIFGGAGAFMSNVAYRDCHPHCLVKTSRRSDTLIGGVSGALLGAFVGAALGGRRTDTWIPVAVPVRTGPGPTL
jgi:hypothetical protein